MKRSESCGNSRRRRNGMRWRSGSMSIRRRCYRRRGIVRDFQIVEQNLRVAMRFFGEATGAGDVCPLTGVEAIYSGLDYGVFNIAVLSEEVRANGGGLEARIAECARYYGARATRWSFWLCE